MTWSRAPAARMALMADWQVRALRVLAQGFLGAAQLAMYSHYRTCRRRHKGMDACWQYEYACAITRCLEIYSPLRHVEIRPMRLVHECENDLGIVLVAVGNVPPQRGKLSRSASALHS